MTTQAQTGITASTVALRHGVYADLRIDRTEHHRRRAAGLGAVTDLHTLDRLLTLPEGGHILWADLDLHDISVVMGLPEGAAEFSLHGFRRRLVAAATVDLVIVRSGDWRTGLRKASAYVPFASRLVLLREAPWDIRDLHWEMDLAGVGLRVGTLTDWEELIAPAPWQQFHVTAGGWRFRERAYAVWLASGGRSILAVDI